MSESTIGSPKRHRLVVRVSPEQDALIRQAAELEDTAVTAFVLGTATARAAPVIERHRDLVLPDDAFDRFIAALDQSAAVVPELSELFSKHAKLPGRDRTAPRTTRRPARSLSVSMRPDST